jgi:hypothetical protein
MSRYAEATSARSNLTMGSWSNSTLPTCSLCFTRHKTPTAPSTHMILQRAQAVALVCRLYFLTCFWRCLARCDRGLQGARRPPRISSATSVADAVSRLLRAEPLKNQSLAKTTETIQTANGSSRLPMRRALHCALILSTQRMATTR